MLQHTEKASMFMRERERERVSSRSGAAPSIIMYIQVTISILNCNLEQRFSEKVQLFSWPHHMVVVTAAYTDLWLPLLFLHQ